MDEAGSLSHTKWECKYHVIFIPKMRRKALYVQLRKHLPGVFRHMMPDHVHMMISNQEAEDTRLEQMQLWR